MDTQIKFFNRSNDRQNSSVAVVQAGLPLGTTTAWRVIRNCAYGSFHPFSYPAEMSIQIKDKQGASSTKVPAVFGERFTVDRNAEDGLELTGSGSSANPHSIEIRSELAIETVEVKVFKDNRHLALFPDLEAGGAIDFSLSSTIAIGVVPRIRDSQVLGAAVLNNIYSEFSLDGLASADIVMRGGGGDGAARAFEFSLENIVPV